MLLDPVENMLCDPDKLTLATSAYCRRYVAHWVENANRDDDPFVAAATTTTTASTTDDA